MADQLIGYRLDTSYHTRPHVRFNAAVTGTFRTEATGPWLTNWYPIDQTPSY